MKNVGVAVGITTSPPGPDSVPSIAASRLGAAYQIGGAQNLDGSRQRGLRQGFHRGGGVLGAADVGRGQGCRRAGVNSCMKGGGGEREGEGGTVLLIAHTVLVGR